MLQTSAHDRVQVCHRTGNTVFGHDLQVQAAKEKGLGNRRQRIYRYTLPSSPSSYVSQPLPWQSHRHLCHPAAFPDEPDTFDVAAAGPTQFPESPMRINKNILSRTLDDSEKRTEPAPASCASAAVGSLGLIPEGDPDLPCPRRTGFPNICNAPSSNPPEHLGTGTEGQGATRLALGFFAFITAASKCFHSAQRAGAGAGTAPAYPAATNAVTGASQGPEGREEWPVRKSPLPIREQSSDANDVKQAGVGTFSYQQIRIIRETVIINHVRRVGFVLSGEPRLLWFNHAREVRLHCPTHPPTP